MTISFNEITNNINPVVFVLDTPNSSNEWMKDIVNNTIQTLQHISENTSFSDYDIQVGIYISGCNWITGSTLVPIQECLHLNLSLGKKESLTDIVSVLSKALTEKELFHFGTITGILQPSIVFLTNREASHMDIYYESSINDLWNNEIYKLSKRFLISLNDLNNDETFVNLIHEGTYIDILDESPAMINELISDLLINQWTDSKIDIACKYKDFIYIRNIIISE